MPFPRATDQHYETLQTELENNNRPGIWVGQMFCKLETENPTIAEFLWRLFQRFQKRSWYPHATHCACAMYRLLELATDKLPEVKYEVGASMAEEVFRDWKQNRMQWAKRIITENPKAMSVIADYSIECIARGGTEQDASYVVWAGTTVYQYLAIQTEADELAQLPLA